MESISADDLLVFNEVQTLLTTPEFAEAQFTFFEKNQETFEDTDENKLEHSEIFKAYSMILDEIIEVKLLEKFSEEQVKTFYASFAANLSKYENINKDTVDNLFGFQDFDAFKKKMLMYKRGMDDKTLTKPVEDTGALPIAALVEINGADAEAVKKIYYDLAAEDVNDKNLKWKKTLEMPEADGMGSIMYTRPIVGRRVNMCKNVSIFRGVTLRAWFELAVNFIDYMQDDPEFNKNRRANQKKPDFDYLEMSANKKHSILKSVSQFGPMASDRESLVQGDYFRVDDNTFLLIARSIELPEHPVDPKVVRLEYFRCQEVKEIDGDLYTTGFSNIDFKGYFPASLMNMIMSQMISGGKKNSYKKYQMIQQKLDAGHKFPVDMDD